jgi:hypothetical protein
MDNIGIATQLQLKHHIERLDNIYDTVQDTNTTLKRAKKFVTHFARQVYTDRHRHRRDYHSIGNGFRQGKIQSTRSN